MPLREDLKNTQKFVITTELNPPKGTNLEPLMQNAAQVKGLVSAINITDNSGASMKMCSLAVSHLIQLNYGIETVWQMTCRDRNRLGLQSDLLGGIALGIKNILPLRGDPTDRGDHPETEYSFDLQTEELLEAIYKLKQGQDYAGNTVEVKDVAFDYCVAAAAHPGMPDLESQRETMERRIGLGVEFFQTQIAFDKEQIRKFAQVIGPNLASKTLIGITPLKTIGQANFISKNIWGVNIPDEYMERMQMAVGEQDPKSSLAKKAQHEEGLRIANEIITEVKTLGFKGIHIMAIGQESVLDKIIKSIKIEVNA